MDILPVLIGGDMNCYSVARAFHEAYGVKSHAFGRYAMGETKYTRIVKFTAIADIDTDEVLLQTLARFAEKHPGKTKIVLGCTDDYAAMLIRNREALSAEFIVPYIDAALMERLVSKEDFYRICEEYGIPYPATVIVKKDNDMAVYDNLPFAYPVIIKPSSSIAYWKHPFDGMRKVYTANNAEEARKITAAIFRSGYPDTLIVQDRIPGADNEMRVLTAYCDQNAKVKMMCLGHVMLEEHAPKAIGNHAAIITEANLPLMHKIRDFLEAVGFTGIANFDIKHDTRDDSFRVFEINLRQGRSNYYVTGAGLNLARYLVEDRVLNKDLGEPLFFDKEAYWHSIPNKIVWDYTADEDLIRRARALAAAGQDTTSLGYRPDVFMNPLRWAYLQVHDYRFHKKFAAWCEKPRR